MKRGEIPQPGNVTFHLGSQAERCLSGLHDGHPDGRFTDLELDVIVFEEMAKDYTGSDQVYEDERDVIMGEFKETRSPALTTNPLYRKLLMKRYGLVFRSLVRRGVFAKLATPEADAAAVLTG